VPITGQEIAIAGLGVAAATTLANVYAAWQSRRSAREVSSEQFLREQKMKVYEELLAIIGEPRDEREKTIGKVISGFSASLRGRLVMYASPECYGAWVRLANATDRYEDERGEDAAVRSEPPQYWLDANDGLIREIRLDLGAGGRFHLDKLTQAAAEKGGSG
jgi:hypothetical protein